MSGRKITTAVTLVALLLVLVGMAAYGYRPADRTAARTGTTADETCTGAEKEVQGFLKRDEVQVSVFNAGNREGFAGTTLEKLVDAGLPRRQRRQRPQERRGAPGSRVDDRATTTRRPGWWPSRSARARQDRGHRDRPRTGHRRHRRQQVQAA